MKTFVLLLTALTALAMAACGPRSAPVPARGLETARHPVARASGVPETSPLPMGTETPPMTVVAIVDPDELGRLENAGFDVGRLAVSAEARSSRALRALPALKPLFATLEGDVREAARPFPLARVTSVDGFRLFDSRWLSSPEMKFVLTGVFNRVDRRAFYGGTCGEVRFVYRLSYLTTHGGAPMASRLPMTLNVVFLVDDEGAGCEVVAKGWQPSAALALPAVTDWLLTEGALSSSRRKAWRLKSIESNLQTFRLQSSVHPSLGGHIEYALRVFHPNAARTAFEPAPMENMPDVPALAKNAVLRAELLAHLKRPEVLADVDRGTLLLPERFLARRAVSFSPRGLTRAHNRPFQRLFDATDFSGVKLDAYRTIGSPIALLRRLDAASCVGCHQSRAIAGFHHVGLDPGDTPPFNALQSGSSAHLTADLERRRGYVAALASGTAPEEFRPFPERQGTGGEQGAPCGLGDPGFAGWTCARGYRCARTEDPEVGTCVAEGTIGAPCEYGTMSPADRPHRDQIRAIEKHACGAAQVCDTNFQGFPQGSCSASCKSHVPGSRCSDFLDVDGFQNCLRARRSFEQCSREFVLGVAVAACDDQHPCRQDYVCARTRTAGEGACVPPYFVYQLRLDGYPIGR